jgi:hypothetical protein
MTDPELGAQPPHRPAPPHKPVPQVLIDPSEAQLHQARLSPLLCDMCLRPGSQASPSHGALPRCRPHPPNPVLIEQAPHRGGRGAKLGGQLRQRPRLGDQPVYQIGPHAGGAEFGHAGGGALLGGALALTGQQLLMGELVEVVVGDGVADGRLGGGEVGGELGGAPAIVEQGLQAGAQVGEAEASGLLVELMVMAAVDPEATVDGQAAGQACWWGCFPCARGAGRPTTPGDPPSSGHLCRQRAADRRDQAHGQRRDRPGL